jgi:SNF5 / SMARCB1 / INI1
MIDRTAIAHSIREQVHVYMKSLLLIGYEFDGSPVDDDELKQVLLPRVKKSIRNDDISVQFTPVILHLTDPEVEKIERDRMRETR